MIQTALVLGGSSEIAQAILSELQKQGLRRAVLAVRHPTSLVGSVDTLIPGVELTTSQWDATEPADSAQVVAE
ncbi:MAG: hypothetical protein WD029_03955, partial [Microthrixaceae bacterium]